VTTPGTGAPRPFHAPTPAIRVGLGVDVHPLVKGRPLVLGGVTIPFDRGLGGHSDGDVIAHAIADAVLGAAGLGDLGGHFPASDPRWAAADSTMFVRHAAQLTAEHGWMTGNVDVTVCCDQPRLASHTGAMARRMATALGIDTTQVRVAPKSVEGLGFAGRGEGITALAVCLLVNR
jgi:2-C-methyl-D-erythritol 2,4-cyclodiphosphate synthase